MQIIDFHIHSRYAQACSKFLDLEHIEQWCKIKGIDIVACGDFTHPAWYEEISKKLISNGNGFFRLESKTAKEAAEEIGMFPHNARPVQFMLATEVSCIYTQGGRGRRVHLLVAFPELKHVTAFNAELTKRGMNLRHDGRPILGMSAKEVVKVAIEICDKALLIPAHVWTPWFALFGSKSGFDSVEECFEEYSKYIFAFETGLSSDPKMNWRLSQNDKYTLVSNSDAHSLENLGREANVMTMDEVSYDEMYEILKTGDRNKFNYTIEFYPEEGKYHLDGHRDCQFSCLPEETSKLKEICPKCGKKLTVGVHNRISTLADKKFGREKEASIPFKSIIPLQEIISHIVRVGKKSKKVQGIYKELINALGNEFSILLDVEIEAIASVATIKGVYAQSIAEAIKRMRSGDVAVIPGYDGEYGKVDLFNAEELKTINQKKLL